MSVTAQPSRSVATLGTHSTGRPTPNERGVAAMAGSRLDYAISKLHDSPDASAGAHPTWCSDIELLRIRSAEEGWRQQLLVYCVASQHGPTSTSSTLTTCRTGSLVRQFHLVEPSMPHIYPTTPFLPVDRIHSHLSTHIQTANSTCQTPALPQKTLPFAVCRPRI